MLTNDFFNRERLKIEQFYSEISQIHEEEACHQPAPDRWSIKQVIGHLIDSAANNHQRFIRLQTSDLTFPFYDQNNWVFANQYQMQDFAVLVQLWYNYNLQLLHLLASVPLDSLAHIWFRPDESQVTLAFVIEDYFSHLAHHMEKIRERRTARHGA